MVYSVEYEIDNSIGKNFFTFEHEAKHFAIDTANEGYKVIAVRIFGKQFGKVTPFKNGFIFERV